MMDEKTSQECINYFANKYLRSILPTEALDTVLKTQGTSPAAEIAKWERKIAVLDHWDNVIINAVQTQVNQNIAILKQALFESKQVWIEYEGREKRFKFNPFGLIMRDQQFFIVGSYWDKQDPYLLTVRKIFHVNKIEDEAKQPVSSFELNEFSLNYLNDIGSGPQKIEELEIEFPIEIESYVKSCTPVSDYIKFDKDVTNAAYFKLTAKNVENSTRLHQWLSGFQGDIHIIKPEFLRLIINRDLIDNLTHLNNRNFFDHLIRREIHQCIRKEDYCFSLLTLDIDHFKKINDDYGHNVGDQALKHVADTLRDDEAIRYGGEEFYIFLPGYDSSAAQGVAERIRQSIENKPLNSEKENIPLTISIGIAQFPEHLSDENKSLISGPDKNIKQYIYEIIEEIKKRADDALYKAKTNGRNQSVIYTSDLNTKNIK